LRRQTGDRLLAGVAGSLAEALGVSALSARLAFVILSFAGGAGMAAYVAFWLLIPAQGENEPIARRALADRRSLSLSLALASGLVAILVALSVLGAAALLGILTPGAVALAGLVPIWRNAGPDDKAAALRLAAQLTGSGAAMPSRRRLAVAGARVTVGILLVAGGTSAFLATRHLSSADLKGLLATAAVLAGFALVFAPWWLRLGKQLAAERRERARATERAEMASHLHDSVLQTLALIQRAASDPHAVRRLARAQERQLRAWLFEGAPAGPLAGSGGDVATVAEALAVIQRDVEADHGVSVEVVPVGDAPLDEPLTALMAAAREAVVNAAKWSGAELVSVYAEAEPEAVSVFVRDKGRGFDLTGVGPDRRGISESICARVKRHGGTASFRSTPGEGTEVALRMPRRSPS